MKTIKKVQLIAFILVVLNASGFNLNPNQTESVSNEKMTRSNEKVLIQIKNAKGKVIFKAAFEESVRLVDQFDLTRLPKGSYLIERIYDLRIECQPFKVDSDFDLKIECDASNVTPNKVSFGESYKIFKPVILNRGDLIYVSKLTFEEQDLHIKIYNKYNELIYTEDLIKTGKIYDFSNISDEQMKVVVFADGRKYSETFKF